MSTAETADTLDISPSAAKVRLHRARQWLRETLGPILTQTIKVILADVNPLMSDYSRLTFCDVTAVNSICSSRAP